MYGQLQLCLSASSSAVDKSCWRRLQSSWQMEWLCSCECQKEEEEEIRIHLSVYFSLSRCRWTQSVLTLPPAMVALSMPWRSSCTPSLLSWTKLASCTCMPSFRAWSPGKTYRHTFIIYILHGFNSGLVPWDILVILKVIDWVYTGVAVWVVALCSSVHLYFNHAHA